MLALSGTNGVTVTLKYSISSPALLAYQLSQEEARSLALEDLVAMRTLPRFVDHLSQRTVIKQLLRLLSLFVRKHSRVHAEAEAIELVWTTVIQSLHTLRSSSLS